MNHTPVTFAGLKNQFDPKGTVSSTAWQTLAQAVEQVSIAGDSPFQDLPLQSEGTIPEFVYFLADGVAREYAERRTGGHVDRAFHRAPTVLGNLTAHKRGIACVSSLSMITAGTVYRVSCEQLLAIMAEHHDLEHWFLVSMSEICLLLQNRLRNLFQMDRDERLRTFMQQHPDLAQRVPTRYIANYLDVPPVIVNIVKRKTPSNYCRVTPEAALSLTA